MASSVQFVTDEDGNKTAVVLPIAEYEQLMEDMQDLAAIADRRDEPTTKHEQFVNELKQDGILPS
ncbi:MAG: PHD/YefM family antitoxin component YafN of YafNO toxin-antitoxin module [Limisphaerales bacterium]